MRRKNRQIKLMVDIPAEFDDEEDFMGALMEKLDNVSWGLEVDGEQMQITRASLGDIEIEPEEEE